jgi:hypothetical protein
VQVGLAMPDLAKSRKHPPGADVLVPVDELYERTEPGHWHGRRLR